MDHLVDGIDRLNEFIGRACAWLLLPMVALAFSVVALRYVANVGYPWLSEAFVWLNGGIEGLESDPTMQRLRDIALRLPGCDETRVRHELGGNLCRCTGYSGIVRAVCSG